MYLDAIKSFIPKSIPLSLDEARMNALLQEAIIGQSNISDANIVCEDGALKLSARFKLAGTSIVYAVRLGLGEFIITPEHQLITFNRLEPEKFTGNGPIALLMAWFIKSVICGLFGFDITAQSLSSIDGLSIEKDIITADLKKLGLTSKIQQAAGEKISQGIQSNADKFLPSGLKGAAARLALKSAIPGITQKACQFAMHQVQVSNVRISARDGLTGDLMFSLES